MADKTTPADKRLKRNRDRRAMSRDEQDDSQAWPQADDWRDTTDEKLAWYGPQAGSGDIALPPRPEPATE